MNASLGVVGLAVAAFVSTNVDNSVVLALFFSNRAFPVRSVVAGQYLGMGALVAVSLVIASAARLIPTGSIHWLGLVPIAIGIKYGQ